jgi:hypothetical protein
VDKAQIPKVCSQPVAVRITTRPLCTAVVASIRSLRNAEPSLRAILVSTGEPTVADDVRNQPAERQTVAIGHHAAWRGRRIRGSVAKSGRQGAMRRLFIALVRLSFALSISSLTVSAQAVTTSKVVAMDHPLRLAHYANVFPDCSSRGKVEVRVVQGPMHGSVTRREIPDFTYFSEPAYAQCNGRKVNGITVSYHADARYIGPDSVTLNIIYPVGAEQTDTFNITVK